jgi:hypothetical protein
MSAAGPVAEWQVQGTELGKADIRANRWLGRQTLTKPSFARSQVLCDSRHSFSCSEMRSRNLSKWGIAWPEPAFAGFAILIGAIEWPA